MFMCPVTSYDTPDSHTNSQDPGMTPTSTVEVTAKHDPCDPGRGHDPCDPGRGLDRHLVFVYREEEVHQVQLMSSSQQPQHYSS